MMVGCLAPGEADDIELDDNLGDDEAITSEQEVGGIDQALTGQGRQAGSCWGRCGSYSTLPNSTRSCSCTANCRETGDCCSDYQEYCPVDLLPQGADVLCTLAGPSTQGSVPFYGTDLGWTFEHKGKIEVLFGDTWQTQNAVCELPPFADDASGTLPLTLPAQLTQATPSCTGLLSADANGSSFRPLTLARTFPLGPRNLGWGNTPLTAFSDGNNAFAIFRTDNEVVLARRSGDVGTARSTFNELRTLDRQRFHNVSAEAVTSFNRVTGAANYARGTGAVFIWGRREFWTTPSAPDNTDMYLMMHDLGGSNVTSTWSPWYYTGIPGPNGPWSQNVADARSVIADDVMTPNQMDMAYVPQLQKWVMLYGGDLADWFGSGRGDAPRRGAVHLRMADHPWGPWSEPTPALWPFEAADHLACSSGTQFGFETAGAYGNNDSPIGVGQWRFDESSVHASYEASLANIMATQCVPGDWGRPNPGLSCLLGGPPCDFNVPSTCKSRNSALPFPQVVPANQSLERGNMYAPNIIPQWTRALPTGDVELYFNVSTWNPYAVVMAKTILRKPRDYTYMKWNEPYHIHDYNKDPLMPLARSTVPTAEPSNYNYFNYQWTHWRFRKVDASGDAYVDLGDRVRIEDSDGRCLHQDGSNATWLGSCNDAGSIWRIVSGGGPTSGRVRLNGREGQTVFIEREDGSKRMKSTKNDSTGASEIRTLSGAGGSSRWRIGWNYF